MEQEEKIFGDDSNCYKIICEFTLQQAKVGSTIPWDSAFGSTTSLQDTCILGLRIPQRIC